VRLWIIGGGCLAGRCESTIRKNNPANELYFILILARPRPVLFLLLGTVALASLRAGTPSPHQPPQPKEEGASRTWAEKYADRKRHWCFQPLVDSPPPLVKDVSWPRSPIDHFILAKLEAAELKPAARAKPEVLARRLSFALTGLPPDGDAAALPYDALVDKLLASPQFWFFYL
jgi:hypothetical protein